MAEGGGSVYLLVCVRTHVGVCDNRLYEVGLTDKGLIAPQLPAAKQLRGSIDPKAP